MELLQHIGINEYAIKFVKQKVLSYRSIYSISLVEFEILKTYIKTHFKTGFLRPSKSYVGAVILFIKKPDSGLCLNINYRGLNILTIKNRYLSPFIDEFLDQRSRPK